MTKSISIKEQGASRSFSGVSRVLTQVSAGSAQWLPEDETMVGEISVTENGEFVPYSDGLYGYVKVTVNVEGGAEETIDNGDGTVTTTTPYPASIGGTVIGIDPDTGEITQVSVVEVSGVPTLQYVTLTEENLYPASIDVLIEPRKTSYRAGERISYDGMTVVALDSRGYLIRDTDAFSVGGVTYGPYVGGLIPESELSLTKYALSGMTAASVSWVSPYDGQTYSDTIPITVS